MKYAVLIFAACLWLCATAKASPFLIGGTPADPKDWPASVYASMSNARCSATVVGERVLLIAAHCVRNGGTASFAVGAHKYASKCTHAPEYVHAAWREHQAALVEGTTPFVAELNSTADWALCLVDKPVLGAPFEKVAVMNPFKVGDQARLTGYGCVRPGGGGGNDGVFRIGMAQVTRLPSGSNNDTVTRGGAALCYGDSGGGAYYENGKDRLLFGVNSRGDIRTTSYLSSTFTGTAQAFFKAWAEKNAEKICGVHVDAKGCRNSEPMPETRFEVDSKIAKVVGEMKPGHEGLLERVKMEVQKLLDGINE